MMKYFDLIQCEFTKYARSEEMCKIARRLKRSKSTTKDFLNDMGDKNVTNPSAKGKKRTIKVKSLKSGDERQKQLFKQLYKQWKGSKTKKVDKKDKLKSKVKKRRKQIRQEFKKKKQEIKKEPTEKKKIEKVKMKVDPKKIEEHRKDIASETKSNKEQQVIEKQISEKLKAVGDKSDEQYKSTISVVKKNEKSLYRDTSDLNDPLPPDPEKLKTIDTDQKSLSRAMKALDISNSEISDVVNSPNVVTYKISLKNLSDKDKARAMHKLLSTESKTVLSHFIGKKENVTVNENRDTDTIDVHVPKGTDLKDRDPVSFKELITNDKFVKASKDPTKLPIAFGKDENNNTVTYDFSNTPHLIVSGATKSGKSVFNQSIINSIQMGKSPDEAKLILIDAAKKGAEFAQYKDSEYLDRPIATSAKEAEDALQSLSDEVNRRNEFLKTISGKTGMSFRNIEEWNSFVTKDTEKMSPNEQKAFNIVPEDQRKKMHRIVTIVDEAKDLFNKEVNPNAPKLFNLVDHMLTVARSVGAHMVIATQSPAKQNIPGKIQANIGAKMTFRLQNKSDAENIGVPDATDLLMYGDGYFEDPSMGGGPTRLQTGFIDKNDDAKISEKTKGEQKFIEREKKVVPKPVEEFKGVTDPAFLEFKQRMSDVHKQLDEQRIKIQERLKELKGRESEIEKEHQSLREQLEERRRKTQDIRQQQSDVARQKERSPAVEVEEEPVAKEPTVESSSPDVASEIEELTKTVPVSDVKKEPKAKELERPTEKRKSLLDRIKKMFGKKSSIDMTNHFIQNILT